MNFFNFMKQKQTASFTTFVYFRTLLINAAAFTIIVPYVAFFLKLSGRELLAAYFFVAIVFNISQFMLLPLLNFFMTHKISLRLRYWRMSGLSEKTRTKLYKDMMRYPWKESVFNYVCFLIGVFIFLRLCRIYFGVDTHIIGILYASLGIVSYLIFLETFHILEKDCSNIAMHLVGEGISKKEISKKKFFGISTKWLFVMYIIVPIILSGLLLMTDIGLKYFPVTMYGANSFVKPINAENVKVVRTLVTFADQQNILFVSVALNLTIMFVAVGLFFGRIRRFYNQMSQTLSKLSDEAGTDLRDVNVFSVDLSSEFSYSMHLINQVVLLFRSIIAKTLNVNEQISDYVENLSSTAWETSSTAVEQVSGIEQVLATINTTGDYSTKIETKVNEIVKIAESTISDVEKNTSELNENLLRMQEITEINKNTISGIENLYAQINSISDIVNLINSVASQINIIAFNTELEMGNFREENVDFQNVVIEIRQLTNSTMRLTKEIGEKIRDIQNSSRALIITGQECMKKIKEGNVLSDSLSEKLLSVNDLLKTTSADAFEVNNFVFEQTSAMEQIKNTLEQISEGMTVFMQTTDNITGAVKNLQVNSRHLHDVSKEVKKDDVAEVANVVETTADAIETDELEAVEELEDL